jgi:hypothetical protein
MTRQTIGEVLAERLYAAEAAIDAALAETATFTAMLPKARADAYLSAGAGQKAFDGAAASVKALTEARGHLVDTHRSLSALARLLGLPALAVGPIDKPDDDPPVDPPKRLAISEER